MHERIKEIIAEKNYEILVNITQGCLYSELTKKDIVFIGNLLKKIPEINPDDLFEDTFFQYYQNEEEDSGKYLTYFLNKGYIPSHKFFVKCLEERHHILTKILQDFDEESFNVMDYIIEDAQAQKPLNEFNFNALYEFILKNYENFKVEEKFHDLSHEQQKNILVIFYENDRDIAEIENSLNSENTNKGLDIFKNKMFQALDVYSNVAFIAHLVKEFYKYTTKIPENEFNYFFENLSQDCQKVVISEMLDGFMKETAENSIMGSKKNFAFIKNHINPSVLINKVDGFSLEPEEIEALKLNIYLLENKGRKLKTL